MGLPQLRDAGPVDEYICLPGLGGQPGVVRATAKPTGGGESRRARNVSLRLRQRGGGGRPPREVASLLPPLSLWVAPRGRGDRRFLWAAGLAQPGPPLEGAFRGDSLQP